MLCISMIQFVHLALLAELLVEKKMLFELYSSMLQLQLSFSPVIVIVIWLIL